MCLCCYFLKFHFILEAKITCIQALFPWFLIDLSALNSTLKDCQDLSQFLVLLYKLYSLLYHFYLNVTNYFIASSHLFLFLSRLISFSYHYLSWWNPRILSIFQFLSLLFIAQVNRYLWIFAQTIFLIFQICLCYLTKF